MVLTKFLLESTELFFNIKFQKDIQVRRTHSIRLLSTIGFILCFIFTVSAQDDISSVKEKMNSFESIDSDSVLFYRNRLALAYRNKSQYDLAKNEFLLCADLYKTSGKDSMEAVIYNNLGEVYMLMAKYDTALYYHQQALDIRRASNNIFGQGASYLNMGNVYLYQSSFDTALIFYNKSIDNFKVIKDSLRLASVYNNIGAIHSYIGNTNEVIDYWEKSLSIKEALGESKAIAVSKNNLAELYISQGKLDLAKEYLIDAIDLKEQQENVESLVTSYFNLSEVHKLQGAPEASLKLLKQAENKLKNTSSAYLKAELNNKLGNYYFEKNNLKLAETYILKAIKNAEGGKVNEIQLTALEKIAEVYKRKGSFSLALQYSEAFHQLKDSLLGESQQGKILELETQYDVKSKAQEIQLLQSEKKFQLAENQRIKLRIIYLIVGLFLFLISTILLLRNVRLKRRNNKLLEEKNKQIASDLETKNFLLKEIQHRIKNNLSVVDSLINLQLLNNPTADPKDALTNAQNRIRSISLLYDLLYGNADFQDLTLDKYVDELCNQLDNSLGFQSRNIRVEKDLDRILISKDSFINIGLVINELFTNANKHGFDDEGGTIFISLKAKEKVRFEIYHTGKQLHVDEVKKSNGLGMQLIKGLSNQIDAAFTMEEGDFTKFILTFAHE